MGFWTDVLIAYGVALATIAGAILAPWNAGRRRGNAGTESPPALVVSDGGRQHRPAA